LDLTSVRIEGFDSISEFNGFNPISSRTLTSRIRIQQLRMNLIVNARDTLDATLNQEIAFSITVEDLLFDAAIFLAGRADRLQNLRFGSLMITENLFPCLASVIDAVEVSNVDLSIGAITRPIIRGLLPDTIGVANTVIGSMWRSFGTRIRQGAENLIKNPIRDAFSNLLSEVLPGRECPEPIIGENSLVDFRELLLSAEESILLGGAGLQPYGRSIPRFSNFVRGLLEDPADDGLPSINELVIRPLTELQSGTPGLLNFSASVNATSDENLIPSIGVFDYSISNIRFENMDAVDNPFSVLYPTNEPDVLFTQVTFGVEDKGPLMSFDISAEREVLWRPGGVETLTRGLQTRVSIKSLTLEIKVSFKILKNSLLSLPVISFPQLDCWLGTLQESDIDEGISVVFSNTTFMEFDAELDQCFGCPFDERLFGRLLQQALDLQGFRDRFAARVVDSFFTGDAFQAFLNNRIAGGRDECPTCQTCDDEEANEETVPTTSPAPIASLEPTNGRIFGGRFPHRQPDTEPVPTQAPDDNTNENEEGDTTWTFGSLWRNRPRLRPGKL